MAYKRWCRTCAYLDMMSVCGKLGIKRDADAQECPSENRSCQWTAAKGKNLEEKQFQKALSKEVTGTCGQTVDNLLVLIVVLNKETGKILDVSTKPSILTDKLTD